ncbi:GGDEF domain-containing protein [Psychromonas sp. psych-6C06]|uniref:GGDEF domain-containing protein n=1 Tax=Psychromonas sp. psych-6C06 TaxID=2058089 RepID=UPI000C349340|nr:GGDEF domain-containing protein [Psychromonas sp. psych-6C06]PKF60382.1 GGDEF domain-containing protein [Psychromonas sp. psych-6C06]
MDVLNQQGEIIELDTGFRFGDAFFSLLNFIKKPTPHDAKRTTCEAQCYLFYRDIMNYGFVDSHNQHLADGRLDLAAKNLNAINDIAVDDLTGLKKKEYLKRKLISLESEVYLGELSDFSLIICDLDKFKDINDDFGHSVGDDVLELFGKLLLETIRPSDFAYRYGGEEFLILLPETNLQEASLVAKRLCLVIDERLQVGHYGLNQVTAFDLPKSEFLEEESGINDAFFLARNVTCSFGVANYLENDQSTDTLFLSADENLYIAKENGRNQVAP